MRQILAVFMFVLSALGSISVHADDYCNERMGFTPHVYTPPVIRSRDLSVNERSTLELVIDEAQTVFDQGSDELVIPWQESLYRIRRLRDDDGLFYTVKVNGFQGRIVDHIRILEAAHTGGLARQFYVKDRELKEVIAKIPVNRLNLAVAARFMDTRTGRTYFAVYRDNMEKGEISREIIDLTYARPYRIANWARERIMTRHRVQLANLDQAFASWDGVSYPDIYIDRAGNAQPIKNPEVDEHGGHNVWFLAKDESDQPLRVVLYVRPDWRLPEVVTAYRPHARALDTLMNFIGNR